MPKTNHNKTLWETADSQGGYFTAKQAIKAGFADNTHPYHVRVGNWLRGCRGVYRLTKYPRGDDGQLILWYLWSRSRADQPQGVYSHLTALRIHELSDAMPSRLDMTVPPNFRRNSPIPRVLTLHRALLEESDIQGMPGFKVTTPFRTVLDIVEAGTVSREIVGQAIREARARGLMTLAESATARKRRDLPRWVNELFGERLK
ncbi:MAG: hypothetical protein KJ964_06895 [Verrucomicrobia bacterium]|nr:hypothetical protein [Verrucomicrobiota bacterium]MBU1736214.1 hypothetical protein [Verrucomicrobiota bacterium]MBU1857393.1 hypothetical protein [Verrucomicrobiota bacterium]